MGPVSGPGDCTIPSLAASSSTEPLVYFSQSHMFQSHISRPSSGESSCSQDHAAGEQILDDGATPSNSHDSVPSGAQVVSSGAAKARGGAGKSRRSAGGMRERRKNKRRRIEARGMADSDGVVVISSDSDTAGGIDELHVGRAVRPPE